MSAKRKSSDSAAPQYNQADHTATESKHGAPNAKRAHKEQDTVPAAAAAAHEQDQPAVAASSSAAAAPMSEHQRFMQQAYQISSSSVPSRLSSKSASSAVASATPLANEEKQLTAEQLAFVNSGLARWQETRTTWIAGRDDKAKQKRAAAAAAGSSSAAAAAPSGKTALPHPPSARPRSKYQATSDSDSPGDPYMMDSSSGSDSDSSDEEDINKNIPAILAAREAYSEFQPRVKLSHMVGILQAVWEEEEDD